MQKSLTISLVSLSLLLVACEQARPIERPQQQTMSGSVFESETAPDSPNERTPETTDSLEIGIFSGAALSVHATASGTILTGDPAAPHRLMIFSDYDCAYCSRFSATDLPWIESITLSNELTIEHIFVPMSEKGEFAARLSVCAAEQQKFLEAHRWLATHAVGTVDIKKFATAVGINLKKLTLCTTENDLLASHRKKAEEYGVERVPYFVLGKDSWLGLLPKEELQKRMMKTLNE